MTNPTRKELHIRSGPLVWRLPFEDLEAVSFKETLSTLGVSLGWSMDKVGVKFRGRRLWFWVAPEDKAAFVAELKAHRPDLHFLER